MNFAAEMTRLPEPPNDSAPPLWNYWRHDLWQRAQEDDPHNFMRWPCIYHTMLQDHWRESITVEEKYIEQRINHSRVIDGPYSFLATNQSLSSLYNLIHQAYHILRWQDATGLRIADMQSIYEFGGGYGAMALVCNRLGFKGKYYIYDLPEFSLLQRWYLEECGVDNVEWTDDMFYGDVDLMIACYSLSEVSFKQRSFVLTDIAPASYLFLYSNKFEQFDNATYFQHPGEGEGFQYNPLRSSINWRHEHIEHLPPESWYSFGW